MPGKLESSVEDYLVAKVEELGGVALKGAVPGRRFIDRIIILPHGVTIWCECKRPKGGVYSGHQIETLERLDNMGHITWKVKDRREIDALVELVQSLRATKTHLWPWKELSFFCTRSSLRAAGHGS